MNPSKDDKLLKISSAEDKIPNVVFTTGDFGSNPARIDVTNTDGWTRETAVIVTVYPIQAGGTFSDSIKIQYLAKVAGDTFFTIYKKLSGDDSEITVEGARVQCNVDSQWARYLINVLLTIFTKEGVLTLAEGGGGPISPQLQALINNFDFSENFETSPTVQVNAIEASGSLELSTATGATGWVSGNSLATPTGSPYWLLVRTKAEDLVGRMRYVLINNETIYAGLLTRIGNNV